MGDADEGMNRMNRLFRESQIRVNVGGEKTLEAKAPGRAA
jgi:hypothetical protein